MNNPGRVHCIPLAHVFRHNLQLTSPRTIRRIIRRAFPPCILPPPRTFPITVTDVVLAPSHVCAGLIFHTFLRLSITVLKMLQGPSFLPAQRNIPSLYDAPPRPLLCSARLRGVRFI
jgi:hypothetical protein